MNNNCQTKAAATMKTFFYLSQPPLFVVCLILIKKYEYCMNELLNVIIILYER